MAYIACCVTSQFYLYFLLFKYLYGGVILLIVLVYCHSVCWILGSSHNFLSRYVSEGDMEQADGSFDLNVQFSQLTAYI
jgi:hypothetical protein